MPFGAIMLICHDLLRRGRFESAFMVALAFETYLRPSELVAFTGQQVTLPATDGRGAARCAAITIRAEELQIESNIGQFDGCVLLDLAPVDGADLGLPQEAGAHVRERLGDEPGAARSRLAAGLSSSRRGESEHVPLFNATLGGV